MFRSVTTTNAEEQRTSSARLSRSTPSTNQPPGLARRTKGLPAAAPAPPPRANATVQLSSMYQTQRSSETAASVAAQGLPPPPQRAPSGSNKPPSPQSHGNGQRGEARMDRSVLPEALVETMDHIVGQVREESCLP